MKRKQIVTVIGPFKDNGCFFILIHQYDAFPGECYPHKTEKRLLYDECTAEEIGQLMGGN